MDEELEDPVTEDGTGMPQSDIPNKKRSVPSEEGHKSQCSSTVLKHKLPSLLTIPKEHFNSNTKNVLANKLVVTPRSVPMSESFILKQDHKPPLFIPLNVEGDKIVSGLFDDAIEEYLKLQINELSVRQKYKWMDRWAVLRYKQIGETPKLSKYDTQSLDEILDYESDMDQEQEPTTPSSHSTYLPQVYRPRLYSNSVANVLPQGSARASVRPRVIFYNSDPEDFGVEDPVDNELTRSGEINDSPSRSEMESGNRDAEDSAPAVNSIFIPASGHVRKGQPKRVTWSPRLVQSPRSFSDDQFDSLDEDSEVVRYSCQSTRVPPQAQSYPPLRF